MFCAAAFHHRHVFTHFFHPYLFFIDIKYYILAFFIHLEFVAVGSSLLLLQNSSVFSFLIKQEQQQQ